MTVQSWSDGLRYLRGFPDVADAQAQAVIVAQASHRWSHAVVARVGRYATVFTRPGDEPPFAQTVRLEVVAGGSVTLTWFGERSQEKRTTDLLHVDGLLGAFLERLTSPALTCSECGERRARLGEVVRHVRADALDVLPLPVRARGLRPRRGVRGRQLPLRGGRPVARHERPSRRARRPASRTTCGPATWRPSPWGFWSSGRDRGSSRRSFDGQRYLVTVRRIPERPAEDRSGSDRE